MSTIAFSFEHNGIYKKVVAPANWKIIDAFESAKSYLCIHRGTPRGFFINNKEINPNLSINYYFADIKDASGIVSVREKRELMSFIEQIRQRNYNADELNKLSEILDYDAFKKEKEEKAQQEFDDELNESASK